MWPVADLWATDLVAGLPSACCRRTPDNRLGLYSDCRLGLYSDGPPTRTILVTKLRAGLTASSGSWRARHPSRAASTFPRRSASSPRSTAGADALRRPDRLGGDSDMGTLTEHEVQDRGTEHEVQDLRAPVHDALMIARCPTPDLRAGALGGPRHGGEALVNLTDCEAAFTASRRPAANCPRPSPPPPPCAGAACSPPPILPAGCTAEAAKPGVDRTCSTGGPTKAGSAAASLASDSLAPTRTRWLYCGSRRRCAARRTRCSTPPPTVPAGCRSRLPTPLGWPGPLHPGSFSER